MNIYLIPGLAADHRVFNNIRVPEGYTTQCIQWIEPEKDETLSTYALKLAEQFDTSQPFVLMGLSMGGMLATEIAKQIPVQKLILISSITSHKELPSWYRWSYFNGGKYFMHPSLLKNGIFIKRFFTSESKEDKELIRQMANEMDPVFLHQCIHLILKWKTSDEKIPAFKIHGSADWILPLRNTTADVVIKNAGHLMIFNRANEINEILRKIL